MWEHLWTADKILKTIPILYIHSHHYSVDTAIQRHTATGPEQHSTAIMIVATDRLVLHWFILSLFKAIHSSGQQNILWQQVPQASYMLWKKAISQQSASLDNPWDDLWFQRCERRRKTFLRMMHHGINLNHPHHLFFKLKSPRSLRTSLHPHPPPLWLPSFAPFFRHNTHMNTGSCLSLSFGPSGSGLLTLIYRGSPEFQARSQPSLKLLPGFEPGQTFWMALGRPHFQDQRFP